ncbi:MAG: beta-lactamase family protein [Candidatus Latescibacteria bacterium]|nr:beta-lactamase family protein [Candidatus Latescibacterota bacterium]
MADLQHAVQQVLDQLVASGEEVGLQAAVYLDGELAADAVAGVKGRGVGDLVAPDTLFTIYSCSKGVIASAVHLLAQRGLVDYDRPVASYWPEFGTAGKDQVTVAQAMNHLAGIPQAPVVAGLTQSELWCDLDRVVAETARLVPHFAPGTTSYYHALTIGWILEGLVRQVDGRSLGQVIREEIAGPLGITDELFLGTPPEVHHRMAAPYDAPVETPPVPAAEAPSPDPLAAAILPAEEALPVLLNRPVLRQAQVPAVNVSATARALAKHYAALVGEVEGCRLLRAGQLEAIFSRQADLPDRFVNLVWQDQQTPRVLGYSRSTGRENQEFYCGPGLRSFGHSGYGGSYGFADPDRRLGFGYTKTLLPGLVQPAPGVPSRTMQPEEMSRVRVMKAVYAALA